MLVLEIGLRSVVVLVLEIDLRSVLVLCTSSTGTVFMNPVQNLHLVKNLHRHAEIVKKSPPRVPDHVDFSAYLSGVPFARCFRF